MYLAENVQPGRHPSVVDTDGPGPQKPLHERLGELEELMQQIAAEHALASASEVIDLTVQHLKRQSGASTHADHALQDSAAATNTAARKTRFWAPPDLVDLLLCAKSQRREHAHALLCRLLASAIDEAPGAVRALFAGPSPVYPGAACRWACKGGDVRGQRPCQLPCLDAPSGLQVLRHVADLERAVQVFPPWHALLRTAAAETVYKQRLPGVGRLYEAVIADSATGVLTWQDAMASFRSVCTQSASPEHLGHLLLPTVMLLATETPEAMAELGMLLSIVAGLGGAAPSAFAAAAESLMASLSQRLFALSHANTPRGCADFFSLLALTKEVFKRCKEMALLCFHGAACDGVLQRLSQLWDRVVVNFAMSAKTVAMLRHLTHDAVRSDIKIAAFLSGLHNMLPPGEADRLGVRPHFPEPDVSRLPAAEVAVSTVEGACVRLSSAHVARLTRVADMRRLLCSWRLAGFPPELRRCGHHAGGADGSQACACAARLSADACAGVPLPVPAYVLRTLTELADILDRPVLVGGPAAQQHMAALWLAEVTADAALLNQVHHAALLLGASAVTCALQSAGFDAGPRCH